jgi:Icc-related predicted phosphoesterase
VIRIAAIGDVHFAEDARGTLAPHLAELDHLADVLLIAGDLTRHGLADEAAVFADEVRGVTLPSICVLGNHDYHAGEEKAIHDVMEDAGVRVLEGEGMVVDANGTSVGIAGAKGFGGGFAGASGSEFGEMEMKSFIRHTREIAEKLGEILAGLGGDRRVALLHYSPTDQTLRGERLEIYPFLGSYLLAEAIDEAGADLVIHGHSHGGSEKGMTPGGIQVRNVAQPLLQRPYALYCLGPYDDLACPS